MFQHLPMLALRFSIILYVCFLYVRVSRNTYFSIMHKMYILCVNGLNNGFFGIRSLFSSSFLPVYVYLVSTPVTIRSGFGSLKAYRTVLSFTAELLSYLFFDFRYIKTSFRIYFSTSPVLIHCVTVYQDIIQSLLLWHSFFRMYPRLAPLLLCCHQKQPGLSL